MARHRSLPKPRLPPVTSRRTFPVLGARRLIVIATKRMTRAGLDFKRIRASRERRRAGEAPVRRERQAQHRE
jgi:hypothetical protein